jgi:hypothetical protein
MKRIIHLLPLKKQQQILQLVDCEKSFFFSFFSDRWLWTMKFEICSIEAPIESCTHVRFLLFAKFGLQAIKDAPHWICSNSLVFSVFKNISEREKERKMSNGLKEVD